MTNPISIDTLRQAAEIIAEYDDAVRVARATLTEKLERLGIAVDGATEPVTVALPPQPISTPPAPRQKKSPPYAQTGAEVMEYNPVRLRSEIERRGLTLAQAARGIGCSESSLYSLLKGGAQRVQKQAMVWMSQSPATNEENEEEEPPPPFDSPAE